MGHGYAGPACDVMLSQHQANLACRAFRNKIYWLLVHLGIKATSRARCSMLCRQTSPPYGQHSLVCTPHLLQDWLFCSAQYADRAVSHVTLHSSRLIADRVNFFVLRRRQPAPCCGLLLARQVRQPVQNVWVGAAAVRKQ